MDTQLPIVSDTVTSDTFLSNLEQGRKICVAAIKQEVKDRCDKPIVWDASQTLPPAAIRVAGHTEMDSMRQWALRDAPDRAGILTPERWVNGEITWDVLRTRLTDAGCVFALLMLSAKDRANNLPFDFDARGEVRRTRVPRPPTVVAVQNNVRFLIAWRDTYVFTGGYNDEGWLLQTHYPEKQSPFKKGWLRAGLVLAPAAVQSSSSAGGLDCNILVYERSKPVNIPVAPNTENPFSTWDYGYQKHGVSLRGTQPASAPATTVLHIEGLGYLAMGEVPGFTRNLKTNKSNARPATWNEIANCRGFNPIEWGTTPTPAKKLKTVKDTETEEEDPCSSNDNKNPEAESNDAVVPPPARLDIRSSGRQDLQSTALFANTIAMMKQVGIQRPALVEEIASLDVARMAIRADEVALSVLQRPLQDSQRQQLSRMLLPSMSDTEAWMHGVVSAVGTDDTRRNAVLDALNYHTNLNHIEEVVADFHDEDTSEANCCRALLDELKR